MLETLDQIPWETLSHVYGSAADVPELLRAMLSPSREERDQASGDFWNHLVHQGTRTEACVYVIPFLFEMIENETTPDRHELLHFLAHAITAGYEIDNDPYWALRRDSDGRFVIPEQDDHYHFELHKEIYLKTVARIDVPLSLLKHSDPALRAYSSYLLACLPTEFEVTTPALRQLYENEHVGQVRAAIAFALGSIRDTKTLWNISENDVDPAVRCVAVCQLAKLDPQPQLADVLIAAVADEIEGFENIPGTGGKSSVVAAAMLRYLPKPTSIESVMPLLDRFVTLRSWDAMKMASALLSLSFEKSDQRKASFGSSEHGFTPLQRKVLLALVARDEIWSFVNWDSTFQRYGRPFDRKQCAALLGIEVADNPANVQLCTALLFAEMNFLDKAREGIERAIELDSQILESSPQPDETWLLAAKAFAPTDPQRAIEFFKRAHVLNPSILERVDYRWELAKLVDCNR